jgi:hypothetical protein
MSTERVYRGGRPRTQGWEEDPLVTVSVHLRKSHLVALDQLAGAEHTSRAELVREAIDLLLKRLKLLLKRLTRPMIPTNNRRLGGLGDRVTRLHGRP